MAERPAPLVLITRPEDSAGPLRDELEARGLRAMIEPLLTIEPLGPVATLPGNIQAIALTSANAVPALSDEARRLPVFTVGKATAAAARAAGCGEVVSGDGDARALAALIAGTCRPEHGAILHLAGEVVREELRLGLEKEGFALRQEVVYRAVARAAFSPELQQAWHRREIAAVLLFSARTADILVRLLADHGLTSQVDSAAAICLSDLAATPCRRLDWKDIRIAAHPNRKALIRALEGSIGI